MKIRYELQFTVGPTRACYKSYSRSAAVWIMMALIVAPSSLARDECIGTMVRLEKGEAVLRCPLTVNVMATRHSVVIQYFPEPESSSEDVLDCHWLTEEAKDPDCNSRYNWSLGSQLTDQMVARVPVSRLNNTGAYKCRLVPPDNNLSSTLCQIYPFSDNDEAEQHAVTGTPVVSPDSSDTDMPDQKPLNKETSHCAERNDITAMTGAVLGLQVIIVLLLAANIFFLRCQKKQQCRKMSASDNERGHSGPANYHPPPPLGFEVPLLIKPEAFGADVRADDMITQSLVTVRMTQLMDLLIGRSHCIDISFDDLLNSVQKRRSS